VVGSPVAAGAAEAMAAVAATDGIDIGAATPTAAVPGDLRPYKSELMAGDGARVFSPL